MSALSESAAIMWRRDREVHTQPVPCNRWWVYRGGAVGEWLVSPPCHCDGEHEESRTVETSSHPTHAEAIAYADSHSRAHVLPSTARRRS